MRMISTERKDPKRNTDLGGSRSIFGIRRELEKNKCSLT